MRGTWTRRLLLPCLLFFLSGNVLAQSAVVVSPPTLPDGTVGLAYDQTITASGTTGPYTFTVAVGALPPGLTLAANGDLDGLPTTVGTYNFTIMAADGASNGFRAYTVEIFPQATIEPPGLATAQVGVPYEQQLTVANGGAPAYNFTVSSGSLPAGLLLATDGWITGTPTTAGDANFTVTATPTAGPVVLVSRAYTLSVVPAPIVLSPTSLPDATVGSSYSQFITASGGIPPYSYSASGALPPGMTLTSFGRLSGTPTTAGDYAFVVHATDSLGTSGGLAYDLSVAQPPLVLPAGGVPDGTVGIAYEHQFAASGGYPPYFYYAGTALPPGLTLEGDGLLHGTPTAEGAYSFEVEVYDASAASTSRIFGMSIAAAEPVAVDDEATTPSQQAVAIAVADNDVGIVTAIALVTPPSNGTATINGLAVDYEPSGTFFGDDSFTYTASGPGGVSAPATVVIHVTALDAPTGVPQAVTTLPGVAVTIHAAAGASGGPFTEVVVQAPATGSVEVSGTDIAYTPPGDATPGDVIAVIYTLSNAYGTSAPVSSSVTIETPVEPPPEAIALEATTQAGVPVDIDLTGGASGGPFVAAEVLSLSPQDAGTATVAASADGYRLTFTPAVGFVGVAVAGFTLSNANATSAPATVTITVTERPDPTHDPEVSGLAGAQVFMVRGFADAQILNVQSRLESLHEPGAKPWGFWIGGAIRKGDSPGREFETSGMSGGADYRFSDKFAFGGGIGYGRDRTTIGANGSRADARAKSGMGYASYRPSLPWFIDMIGGYQRMTFQLRRFVGATGELVEAPRDGTQAFNSWSSGYEHKGDAWMFATYGRMDLAQAKLDEYSEGGDPVYALTFGEQSIQTRTSTLGVRGKYKRKIRWGTLEPKFRIELQRDFHDESGAAITYSDLQSGPVYLLPGGELDRNRYVFELGTVFKSRWGFVMRLEYRGVRGGLYDDDNAIMFSFQDDH